jgi:DNA-directed RNA polymerase III subunit RPC1
MNLHLPQTEEARTEASLLMGVESNLVTPRNGEPLVAASQDFLSASYLLTQVCVSSLGCCCGSVINFIFVRRSFDVKKSQFFTFEQFCQLAGYFGDAAEHIDVPWPALVKPVPLWTGKQIFTLLLYPNNRDKVPVSFEHKEKNYAEKKSFCPNDGWVAFRGGELVSGNIAKKTIGNGSKTGLIYVLLRDHGCKAAATCLNRWARFCGRYMGGHRGLSIGISDVTPSERLRKMKYDILHEGYVKVW